MNIKFETEVTREEAIAMIGEKAVNSAENAPAEYTNACGECGENGYYYFVGNGDNVRNPTGCELNEHCFVTINYHVESNEYNEAISNGCDLDTIDWENAVTGYTIRETF